jgi:hypothetical protein
MPSAKLPRTILAIAALSGLGIGAAWLWITHDPTAVRVGDFRLTARDVRQRDEVGRLYFPDSPSPLGLTQLVRGYQLAQILKDHGHPLTETDLTAEERRVDKTTLDPKRLRQIRAIFGNDDEAYRRVYILPELAEHAIYFDYFLRDSEIQAPSRERVAAFLAKAAQEPRRFAALAAAIPRPLARIRLSRERGIQWESDPPALTEPASADVRAQAEAWIHHIVDNLHAGDIYPEPVELPETWLAIRYAGPIDPPGTFALDAVSFPKADFGSWLQTELARVPVETR